MQRDNAAGYVFRYIDNFVNCPVPRGPTGAIQAVRYFAAHLPQNRRLFLRCQSIVGHKAKSQFTYISKSHQRLAWTENIQNQ